MFSAARLRGFAVLAASAAALSSFSSEVARPATLSQNQEAPQQQPLRPSPGKQISRPPMRFVLPRRVYACADGVQVVVFLETNAVRLTLKEQVYNLKQVDSANATKYSNGTVVWTTDSTNETGGLEDDADPANPKILARDCLQQSTFPPTAAGLGTINGTAVFTSEPALPNDAALLVRLRSTKVAGESSNMLAEMQVPLKDRSSPVAFVLKFELSKPPRRTPLSLSATVSSGGKVLFRSTKSVPVANSIAPQAVELYLVPIRH